MEMLESYTTIMAMSSEGRHNWHALCTSYFFEMSLHTQYTLEHLEKYVGIFLKTKFWKKKNVRAYTWEMISDMTEHLWYICCGTLTCKEMDTTHPNEIITSSTTQWGTLYLLLLTCSVCTWHQTSYSCDTLGTSGIARTSLKTFKYQHRKLFVIS